MPITKGCIICSFNQIIDNLQSTIIFRSRCESLKRIFEEIKNLFTECENLTPNRHVVNLKKKLDNILNKLKVLSNKNDCVFFLKTSKDFIKEIERVFDIFSEIYFLFKVKFHLPEYDKQKDLQEIKDFLQEINYEADEELVRRYEEVEELLKGINSDFNAIMNKYDKTKKYRIKEDEYEKLKKIESKEEYEVYEGINKRTGDKVTITSLQRRDKFENLFHILSIIDNRSIEKFDGVSINDSNILFVREEREGKKLCDLFQKENLYLTILMYKVAKTMSYLHSRRIVHRNLHLCNLKVEGYGDSKVENINPIITNLNDCIYLTENSFLGLPNIKTASRMTAPELTDSHSYDEKVDVFSFGSILYELCTGEPPFFKEIKEGENINQLVVDGQRPTFPESISNDIKELIKLCWRQKSVDRCSFDEVVDLMSNKRIILPRDKQENKTEIINEYYDKHEIKSTKIIECSKTFDLILNSSRNSLQYMFELSRARSILIEYKSLIRSKYENVEPTPEECSNITQIIEILNKLRSSIDICCGPELFKGCNSDLSVDFLTTDLKNSMNDLYSIIEKLSLNGPKYTEDMNDLTSDYSQLFNHFYFNEFTDSERQELEDKVYSYIKRRNLEINFTNNFKEEIQKLLSPYKSKMVDQGNFFYSTIGSKKTKYSCVYKGTDLRNGNSVAIKIFKAGNIDDLHNIINMRREIEILSRLNNEYILKFIGYNVSTIKNEVWIITEFIPGELFALKDSLDAYKKTKIAFEIAEGMKYLHSQRILHRDLKTSNVMIQDLTPKIIDFGYSRTDICSVRLTKIYGTSNYMAPELIEGNKYNRKVDIFSYSLLLWELYSNAVPYIDIQQRSKVLNAIVNKQRPPFKAPCQPALQKLIRDGWKHEPSERPSFSEIIDRMLEEKISFLDDNLHDEESEEQRKKINDFYEEKRRYYNYK
ncbi:hypothetical protein M9Y10_035458 [Tritrichomonas musculus]|uniref:Protein kinase domain-containing protein n=1 Tax=Tritrichomonas musculus TaxID=1915356 RepID=A0ABR2KIP1_9EUKA